MLYLASVQKQSGKSKLLLAARRRLDNLWMPIAPPQITIDLSSKYERLGEGLLVIADVKEDKAIVAIAPALPEILRSLQEYSGKLARFEKLEESLKSQAEEFFLRRERYDAWEQSLTGNLAVEWRKFCDRYPMPKS